MKKEILQKVETDKKAFRDSNLLLEYKYVSNQDKEYSHSNRIELTRFMHIGGFSIRIYLYSKLSDVSEVSVSVEKYEGTWRGFSNKNIETEPLMLVADHTMITLFHMPTIELLKQLNLCSIRILIMKIKMKNIGWR